MMGKGVVKVVHRCDDAKENNNLGERLMIDNKTYSLKKNTLNTSQNDKSKFKPLCKEKLYNITQSHLVTPC